MVLVNFRFANNFALYLTTTTTNEWNYVFCNIVIMEFFFFSLGSCDNGCVSVSVSKSLPRWSVRLTDSTLLYYIKYIEVYLLVHIEYGCEFEFVMWCCYCWWWWYCSCIFVAVFHSVRCVCISLILIYDIPLIITHESTHWLTDCQSAWLTLYIFYIWFPSLLKLRINCKRNYLNGLQIYGHLELIAILLLLLITTTAPTTTQITTQTTTN